MARDIDNLHRSGSERSNPSLRLWRGSPTSIFREDSRRRDGSVDHAMKSVGTDVLKHLNGAPGNEAYGLGQSDRGPGSGPES